MPKTQARKLRFPPTPEIKRVLSAMRSAGLLVSAVEVEEKCIRVFTTECPDSVTEDISPFDLWKLTQASKKR